MPLPVEHEMMLGGQMLYSQYRSPFFPRFRSRRILHTPLTHTSRAYTQTIPLVLVFSHPLCSRTRSRNIAQQERRDQERVSANADRTAAIEPRIVRAAGWGSAVDIKRGDNISPHSAAGTLGARGLEWGGGSCSTSQFVQTPLNSHLLACRTSKYLTCFLPVSENIDQ